MSRKGIGATSETAREPARPHQPGQADFNAILPEDIEWKPFAAFPSSARLAILVGQPLQDGTLHDSRQITWRCEVDAA